MKVINKGYFSDAFLFKPRVGVAHRAVKTESRGKIIYLACSKAQVQINMCD